MFEPNDGSTRAKLHLALTSFLLALWQRGALAGATPRRRSSSAATRTNNPPDARDSGRLLAEVGVAPSKPFEFVVAARRPSATTSSRSPRPGRVGGGVMAHERHRASAHDPLLNHNFVVSLLDSSSALAPARRRRWPAMLDVAVGGFSECTRPRDVA